MEKNKNISKVNDNVGSQVINVESGGFKKFKRRGDVDKELAQARGTRGVNIFEKIISGDYPGPLTLLLLKKLASEEGVFSEAGAKKLRTLKDMDFQTKTVSNLCKMMHSERNEDEPDIGELSSGSFSKDD